MRHIERLPEPAILKEKHDEWQEKFDKAKKKNSKARPDSSKYGNPKIRKNLEDSSYGKCFYCESKLSGASKEIDHFIEVTMFALADIFRSSGRVVPPLAAGRSPTDEY